MNVHHKEVIISCIDEDDNDKKSSFFNILKRTYTKKYNQLEHEFMNFVLGYRARFLPR